MPAFPSSFAAAALSFADPILIERAEIVAFDGYFFARVWSGDFRGTVALDNWAPALLSLWQNVVLPFWIGRDARALSADLETFARADFAHQLAGAPLWMALAGVELAIWDLLGQKSGRAVAALLCDKPRKKIPIFLSSSRQDSVSAEIESLVAAVEASGARAIAIEVGGFNWDEKSEARNRELLDLAREKWGDKLTIYADADGSFEAEKAIEIGEMLHEYQVAWFEEPCNWEDFEATRAVAASVQLPVAGGAHESSWPKWKWLLENCALDIARPNVFCNGGLLRSLRVTQFAAQLGVSSAPHLSARGPQILPALHLAAALEKPAPFVEWDARWNASPSWFESALEINKGAVALPKSAGWGANYDETIWSRAKILAAARV